MTLSRRLLEIVFIGGLFFLGSVATPVASQVLKVSVKEEAMVRGDKVCLGDIAAFSPPADARVAYLKGLEVASAPSPGNEVRLSRHFLDYKVRSMVGGDGSIQLKMPVALLIRRAEQHVSEKDLEDIFRNYIWKHSSWSRDQIVFDRINTPGRVALPEGSLRWQVEERGKSDYLGNVFLTVSFRVNDRRVRKVAVSGKISIKQDVVMAARKIHSGELISEGDLTLETACIMSRKGRNVLTLKEAVVGKKAGRNIRAGQWITRVMIRDLPLVKKGKKVIIKAHSKSIQVSTLGKVLENGGAGDQVKVVNISSGKEILATVMAPGVVQVQF